MSPIGVTIFTIFFIAITVLFGNFYTKFNVSYNTWLIITIVLSIIMVIDIIYENFILKKKSKKENE